MNQNELMQKVAEWISKTAEQIGDFAAKEIPPFIHEYLTWKFWENAVGVVFHFLLLFAILIALALVVFGIKKLWALAKRDRGSEWDVVATMLSIFGPLFIIINLGFWIGNFPTDKILDCIQIKIAPKVYLVEKASELYKQNVK